jgi:hypothetical protein
VLLLCPSLASVDPELHKRGPCPALGSHSQYLPPCTPPSCMRLASHVTHIACCPFIGGGDLLNNNSSGGGGACGGSPAVRGSEAAAAPEPLAPPLGAFASSDTYFDHTCWSVWCHGRVLGSLKLAIAFSSLGHDEPS